MIIIKTCDEPVADDTANDTDYQIDNSDADKNMNPFINQNLNQEIKQLKSYIVSDFEFKAVADTFKDSIFINPDYNNPLVTPVSQLYGTADVSSMASNLNVSEDAIKLVIWEIKIGGHGQELKDLFAQKDNENRQKIDDLKSQLFDGEPILHIPTNWVNEDVELDENIEL